MRSNQTDLNDFKEDWCKRLIALYQSATALNELKKTVLNIVEGLKIQNLEKPALLRIAPEVLAMIEHLNSETKRHEQEHKRLSKLWPLLESK